MSHSGIHGKVAYGQDYAFVPFFMRRDVIELILIHEQTLTHGPFAAFDSLKHLSICMLMLREAPL